MRSQDRDGDTTQKGRRRGHMNILLFDATSGGHHEIYIRRFVECLQPSHSVTVAAPRSSCHDVSDLPIPTYALDNPDVQRNTTYARLRAGASVWRQMIAAAQSAKADLVIPLYADGLLPYLALRQHKGLRFLPLLFYPRSHYPVHFATPLPLRSRVKGLVYDKLVGLLRRRAGCAGVLTLDEVAARTWSERRGARAHWLPEPPVGALPAPSAHRTGCLIYGWIAPRKRIDLMVGALTNGKAKRSQLTVCGSVADAAFRVQLTEWAAQIRASGASAELLLWRHSELEGLERLASASCTAILYTEHNGMSRTLLEAAAVGTPVIVHDRGLIGHLVREHHLGKVVDCTDSAELAKAVDELCTANAGIGFQTHLAAFAARYSRAEFESALMAAVALPQSGGGAHSHAGPSVARADLPARGRTTRRE